MEYKVNDHVGKHRYKDYLSIVNNQSIPWLKMDNKNVLITGATGFIGPYLVNSLLLRNDLYSSNIKVYALVRNLEKAEKIFKGLTERDDLIFIVQDVVKPISSNITFDFIIHAASKASAWFYENDPVGTLNSNLFGTNNLLDYAKEHQIESMVFLSSMKVYGSLINGDTKITESMSGYLDFTNYKNCYAVGKRAAETLCISHYKQFGTPVKIARLAYIYGPTHLNDDRVWAQFFKNTIHNEDILMKSNGNILRSFCYITDTVAGIFKILLDGENAEPYNVANDESNITIRELAYIIADMPDQNIEVVFENKADEILLPEKPTFSLSPEVMSTKRLQSLGYKPNVSINQGINNAINIMKEEIKHETL